MIKLKEVEVKEIRREIEKATCDWCNKEFEKSTFECNGWGDVHIKFGYGSRYDDDLWIGEICDECFEKHLKSKMRKS